jgi:hypothetical protein
MENDTMDETKTLLKFKITNIYPSPREFRQNSISLSPDIEGLCVGVEVPNEFFRKEEFEEDFLILTPDGLVFVQAELERAFYPQPTPGKSSDMVSDNGWNWGDVQETEKKMNVVNRDWHEPSYDPKALQEIP